MSKLILWKNQEMDKFRRDMDRLFERCWYSFGIDPMFPEWVMEPRIEMTDRGATLEIKAHLQGFSAEELDISIAGTRVEIKAERRSSKKTESGNFKHFRTRTGSFSRVIRLPCRVDADRTSANFRDGVLSISMPKKDPGHTGAVKIEVG